MRSKIDTFNCLSSIEQTKLFFLAIKFARYLLTEPWPNDDFE